MDFINVKQYIKSEFDDIISEASENYFNNNRYDVRKRLSFKCHIE